ncbi:MAG: two-component system response regulator [Flavobacterium sp.]
MTEKYRHFIVIDDDPINNLLCTKNIQKSVENAAVITFTEGEIGLDYIKNNFSKPNENKAILFLDINMPTMSGWEFIEQIEKLDHILKEQLLIYILSSSVNQVDKEKAKNHAVVIDYIEKPLSIEILKTIT